MGFKFFEFIKNLSLYLFFEVNKIHINKGPFVYFPNIWKNAFQ